MKNLAAFLLMAGALMAQKATPVDATAYPKLLSAQKGKVVLASFWATWCVPCRKEMPALVQLNQKLAARSFSLLMISADEPDREAQVLSVLKDNKVQGAAYMLKPGADGSFDKFYPTVEPKWEDGALPALFLYDRTGKKVRTFVGETPTKDIEAAVQKLL
jgi:thiol-disulfide isomerase/thioredoxin